MSVSVEQLLKLPSLRQSKVVAGHKSLQRSVSSISVLESVDVDYLIDDIFASNEIYGGEIVIASFANATNDIDFQCNTIKRMAEAGEVGFILFYVEVFMPKIDQRLIDLANELDFLLIEMPVGRADLRYSDVITDVMSCIFNDRRESENLLSEVLYEMSRMPKHLRTVSRLFNTISTRLRASLILQDSNGNIVNMVSWPRNTVDELKENFEKMTYAHSQNTFQLPNAINTQVYSYDIETSNINGRLFVIKEGNPISPSNLEQCFETVRLSLNIWGQQHSAIGIKELVGAILQDEPIKMYRLAEIFHIDVKSMDELWIISPKIKEQAGILEDEAQNIIEILKSGKMNIVADFFEEELIILPTNVCDYQDILDLVEEINSFCGKLNMPVVFIRYTNLVNTKNVRNSYLNHKNAFASLTKMFPSQYLFNQEYTNFALECNKIAKEGESAVNSYLRVLDSLKKSTDNGELIKTLEVYLLDAECSVTKTANILYLHKNTIKYRLAQITKFLGYKPDLMPQMHKLYVALALNRLIS